MEKFISLCVTFGAVIGLVGFAGKIIAPVDKMYKVIINAVI